MYSAQNRKALLLQSNDSCDGVKGFDSWLSWTDLSLNDVCEVIASASVLSFFLLSLLFSGVTYHVKLSEMLTKYWN